MFAFATETGPDRLPGVAPFPVMARQLPRLLVQALNGDEDRGVRFFPLMGLVDGRRRFFDLEAELPVERLRRLHGQRGARILVDGRLEQDRVHLRAVDGAQGGAVLLTVDTGFDPLDPWPALRRLVFELQGVLGLRGAPPRLPGWRAPLLGWCLAARDELLAIEAGMPCTDLERVLRPARDAFAHAPHDADVARTLLDTCRCLVHRGTEPEQVAELLGASCRAAAVVDADFLAEAALVVEVATSLERAAELYARVAAARPGHPHAAVKAGFGLYELGRVEEGRALLRAALAAGNRDPALRAQLAAAEEECGDVGARDRLLDDLVGEPDLPPAVRRLVASYLVDHDRCAEAIRVLDQAPADVDAQPGLALERARALMALGDTASARAALTACLAAEPPAPMRADARRLLRFAEDPDLLPTIQRIESHLGAGELSAALRGARRLLSRCREVPEAWLLVAIVHQRWGHRRRAMRAFRRCLDLQHDLPDAHNRLGVLLAGSGRHLEAYNHLRFAVELAPNEAGPWLHLAQVCFRLGWRDEAETALGRAQRLGGCEAEVAEVRRQNAPR